MMVVLSVVSSPLARVLRLTAQQRFGGKKKRLAMELQVRGKRKKMVRELQVVGKRKREGPVGGTRKRLKTELLVGATRKRLKMERLVGGKRKSELPFGGTMKRLKRELPPIGGKRKRLTRELPEEVIIDKILTQLPIKSVMRFKSVSKSWLSLLSTSDFIKKHSIRSPVQNPNDYDFFVTHKRKHITIVSRYEETFVLRTRLYSLIGSVYGLVCILCSFKRVSLWNPAIYQSVEFNLPQDERPTLIGVSFDHVTNDCKVVVCYPLLDSCVVYSSNSNSWIQLSVPDHEFLMNKFKESSFIPTTYVNDCPYWTCCTYSSDKKMFVTSPAYCSYGTYPSVENNFVKSLGALKFDATSNKFKLLTEFFPDARSRERGKIFRFVNMRDLLTLLAYEPSSTGNLDLYSLDEEKERGSWIKMDRIGPFEQFGRFQNLQQGFKHGDEIVFFEFGKIYYYDRKRDTFEWLPGIEADTLFNCFTYTPSMVFLKGMKSIYLDNQTRPLGPPQRLITSLNSLLVSFGISLNPSGETN